MLHSEDASEKKPDTYIYNDATTKAIKRDYLNEGEEDQMEIRGYVKDSTRQVLVWILYILSLGSLRLIFHWYPDWHLKSTHRQVPLDHAEKVLFLDDYKGKYRSYFVKNIETLKCDQQLVVYLSNGTTKILPHIRMVQCKKLTYVWDDEKKQFFRLCGLDRNITNASLHTFTGYDLEQKETMRITYGTNEIKVPEKSIGTLLVLEALTPFYIFQVFSLVVWLCEEYYYYTIAIIMMSAAGITTTIIQTRKNQKNLKGTVQSTNKSVEVHRGNGTVETVPCSQLVPGDVITVPSSGCEMQCDAVLLQGTCIVNESMLTGESVPVTKTAVPVDSKKYNAKEHSTHTLFCGTKVIQTRYYGSEKVRAVVIRTGYLTAKGELIRSILYPPPADFKFDQDSYKYIIILAVIAFLGFLYTIFSKFSRAVAAGDIIIKALDLVTIAIPPALPAAMTVGKLYAVNRLKKADISCINSRVINVSGSVDCVCFDKTGTLTEDGLDLLGVVPICDGTLDVIGTPKPDTQLFYGMLTCHSLTMIDNQLCGDPLDVKMFESTGWIFEEPTDQDTAKYDMLVPAVVKSARTHQEIGLVQQYQFSSNLQRMSTICRVLGSTNFQVFCKGSPEMIMQLSKPETIPPNTVQQLKYYTGQGYRVIGFGTKILDESFHRIPKLQREEVENDLTFLGLVVLENRLKSNTPHVIQMLRDAGMKIVMITGDNKQTAVSVAKECGILQKHHTTIDIVTTPPSKTEPATICYEQAQPQSLTWNSDNNGVHDDVEASRMSVRTQLVVSGSAWSDILHYFPGMVPKVVRDGAVFARMTGPQKQQLVEALQNVGYYVAMCGDGANDCGALKAAHVGISLSETESGVASPFTSKQSNIHCVTHVVREGRAALVTSFGVFKFMVCYSLTEFASAILLYGIDCNLTTFQFLFIDVALVLNFASWFGATKAWPTLHSRPPKTSMLGIIPVTSIVLFMLLTVAFQVFAYFYVQSFDWFVPFKPEGSDNFFASYENFAVFSVSLFQYVTMAVVFSKGKPYRKAIFTNPMFLLSLMIMTAICVYLTLYPAAWVLDVMEMMMPPVFEGRWFVIVAAFVNFALCLIVEDVLIEIVLKKLLRRFVEKRKKRDIENEEKSDWNNGSVDRKQCGIINTSFNMN